MIEYHQEDLLKSDQIFIAHGCNAMGVMGEGLAKQIKTCYPWAYEEYKRRYDHRRLILGEVVLSHNTDKSKYIANCITQWNYCTDEQHADYDAIEECLYSLNRMLDDLELTEIAMPWIDCSLSGADKGIVKTLIDEEFDEEKIVHIYYR